MQHDKDLAPSAPLGIIRYSRKKKRSFKGIIPSTSSSAGGILEFQQIHMKENHRYEEKVSAATVSRFSMSLAGGWRVGGKARYGF